ncbi:MAG: glycerophosphodiester phosphodiesterase family protein [Gammaproteobacteria bacterium]
MDSIDLPVIIAHRGASAYAPENTLAAFIKAKELGATWIEFDVMQAACGELCVIHWDLLSRTTNGRGRVSTTTYAEIAKLDAGSWFSSTFSGEKVPTLAEVIAVLSEYDLGGNIELKAKTGNDGVLAQRVVKALHTSWPDHLPPPLVSSFSLNCLRHLRALDKQLRLGLLLKRWCNGRWLPTVEELSCVSVHMHTRMLSQRRINIAKQAQRLLLSYTVNDKNRAQQLLDWGIDGLFSDYPDLLQGL